MAELFTTYNIIIAVLGILNITLVYTSWNVMRKVERYEDDIVKYDEYVNKLSDIISKTDRALSKLDEKGFFKTDDEIGFFFDSVKRLQNEISKFKL